MTSGPSARPAGIDGAVLPGPFPVGAYAQRLREGLRARPRVQLFGEICGLRASRARLFFELRDARGAVPCALWQNELARLELEPGSLSDGAQVVVAGGPDFYPGSATSSPAFSFQVEALRIAGEGDLLAQVDRLRKLLDAEGLLALQKKLRIPALPRVIGVVTSADGRARDDVLAALRRRGWGGRLVWAFAPVQDRHAAPRIGRALQDLAAVESVELVIVARGGGSLADLLAFCDETLCRTVALLRVPVIASVGHHTDRTLLDDVAAIACSTPTHAAEAAVAVHCDDARHELADLAQRLDHHGRRAVVERARALARLSRHPAEHVLRHRARLHQHLRELRASARRGIADQRRHTARRLLVFERKAQATRMAERRSEDDLAVKARDLARAQRASAGRRASNLERLRRALDAHDPHRALERGWALVQDERGEVVTSAASARRVGRLELRFADGPVRVRVAPDSGVETPEHPETEERQWRS